MSRPPARNPGPDTWRELSATERRIVRMLLDAKTTEEIMRAIGSTPGGINQHLARIFRKENVRSQVALVVKYYKAKLRKLRTRKAAP